MYIYDFLNNKKNCTFALILGFVFICPVLYYIILDYTMLYYAYGPQVPQVYLHIHHQSRGDTVSVGVNGQRMYCCLKAKNQHTGRSDC